VIAEGDVDLPADRVAIHVNINASDESKPAKAYDRHLELELKLVKLLQEFQIPDTDITYSLLTIGRQSYYDDHDQKSVIGTSQSVSIHLDSISRYTELQLKLISAGFQNVSANYFSSEAKAGEKVAMKRAIQRAKEKAAILASESGRKLGKILRVSDTEETEPRLSESYRMNSDEIKLQAGVVSSLSQIPQVVKVHAQVKVLFELK
jgi:uncharacterized protein YggE